MKIHTTRDGRKIPLYELTDQHLVSILKQKLNQAQKGLVFRSGSGNTAEDIYYDVDHYTGKLALDYLDFWPYWIEYQLRKIK